MRFSKGPWRLKQNTGGRLHLLSAIGAQIAAFWNCKEREANAHLIAAAPEMYEMLEIASRELLTLIDEVNDQRASQITSATETEPDYLDAETVHLIQLLLAKARGETK